MEGEPGSLFGVVVKMEIDESRQDELACCIEAFGGVGNRDRCGSADSFDAVVLDQHRRTRVDGSGAIEDGAADHREPSILSADSEGGGEA